MNDNDLDRRIRRRMYESLTKEELVARCLDFDDLLVSRGESNRNIIASAMQLIRLIESRVGLTQDEYDYVGNIVSKMGDGYTDTLIGSYYGK